MSKKFKTARQMWPALLLAGLLLALPACAGDADARAGDVIFQTMNTPQSLAIRLATGSEYTHCGLVLEKDGRLQVLEAIGPVTWTPLRDWIARGEKGHYVLMRLKDATPLTPEALAAMQNDAATFAGKPYDVLFQWSDDKIYCSELVWKLYRRNTGLELGPLRRIADYNLDSDEVRRIARQRYGQDLPLDEKVIAPSDLMASALLKVAAKN